MRIMLAELLLPILFACANAEAPQEELCDQVPEAFVAYVARTLTDSTGMFKDLYPPVTPLGCELLGMLQEELKDDSVRYHFERFSRRYWSEDPHVRNVHAYIRRHNDFPLAMAAAAHWYADTRIEGLRELQEYRRLRPLVCTTKEGSAKLDEQDRAAVHYLIRILETTPLGINGSENSTIHDIYMREVMATLDLFTGQKHLSTADGQVYLVMPERELQQAIIEWRRWLNE
jgi:hypothetical protein